MMNEQLSYFSSSPPKDTLVIYNRSHQLFDHLLYACQVRSRTIFLSAGWSTENGTPTACYPAVLISSGCIKTTAVSPLTYWEPHSYFLRPMFVTLRHAHGLDLQKTPYRLIHPVCPLQEWIWNLTDPVPATGIEAEGWVVDASFVQFACILPVFPQGLSSLIILALVLWSFLYFGLTLGWNGQFFFSLRDPDCLLLVLAPSSYSWRIVVQVL